MEQFRLEWEGSHFLIANQYYYPKGPRYSPILWALAVALYWASFCFLEVSKMRDPFCPIVSNLIRRLSNPCKPIWWHFSTEQRTIGFASCSLDWRWGGVVVVRCTGSVVKGCWDQGCFSLLTVTLTTHCRLIAKCGKRHSRVTTHWHLHM